MADWNKVVVILVTAPDVKSAAEIARDLLARRLVACANIIPGIHSLYWWKGELEESDEVLLVLKARREDVTAIAEQVRDLHPYDVPEVVATEVVGGLEAYLEWVGAETERGR
jgi:periplasmic divalent cation tolerance protein